MLLVGMGKSLYIFIVTTIKMEYICVYENICDTMIIK